MADTKPRIELMVLGAPSRLDAQIRRMAEAIGVDTVGQGSLDRQPPGAAPVGERIVVVYAGDDRAAAYDAVARLSEGRPELPIVVLSTAHDADAVLHAMRAGARDYAIIDPSVTTGPDLPDLARAVTAIAKTRVPSAQAPRAGRVVSVFPAKGGAGATTLASNLAGMAAALPQTRALLVDLNLQLGDCLSFLDLDARASIADVLNALERVDGEMLGGMVSVHADSGLHVLSQVDHLDSSEDVTSKKLAALFARLKRHYDVIFVDGLRGFDTHALAALDASEEIVMLLTPDIPSVKNTARCMAIFDRLGYGRSRVRLVVNRYDTSDKLDPDTIAEAIGRPISLAIHNDYPSVISAIDRGALLGALHPRARVTRDMGELLAALYTPPRAAGDAHPHEGVLSRMFHRLTGRATDAPPEATEATS